MHNPDTPKKTTIAIPDAHGGAEHQVEVFDRSVEQFAARLRKMSKERTKWSKRSKVMCYRVYDADLPDYCFAIDVYQAVALPKRALQRFVHIAEYQAPKKVDPEKAAMRYADALAVLPFALAVEPCNVFGKVRRRDKGGAQYADKRQPFVCYSQEGGHKFELDLNGYLDTGLFLDHRVTRGMIQQQADGKRFLNLFSYTGSATVYAAAGGAAFTTTVDLSQTYLDWARRNMALNGFSGTQHSYVRSDTLDFLRRAAKTKRYWDLVFVDPPTFSNSKSMGQRTWDVQRDHVELLDAIYRVLAPGGRIVFSNNLRSFKPDQSQLMQKGIALQDITQSTIPEDYARNPKIHRCYVIDKPAE